MVVVTPTPPAPISSSSGLYQSVSSSSSSSLAAAAASNGSVSANFPTSSSSGVSHQKSLLSSNVPSAVCQVQNLQCSLPETTNLNTVGLMTSEFQGMSFNSTVNNTSPPSSSTCQSDNVVSSCDTQVWSNDGDGQKLCPMNSINSSESDIMPCQQQQQTTGIENTSHGDLVVVATENTVKSNVTEPTTDTHHCSNFQQETIPSSDFDCLSSLPSGEVPSSLDPPPPPSTNHSSASSSTTCQTGNCLSSPNLEMNGSSRRLGGGGGGSSSSSTECQSDDKLLRKSKLADKKRDSSSNSTASGRRCSEAGLNETTASPTSTTTIPLNRRKKNPHSAAAAVASSVSNKQPPPPAQKHSKSPPKKDTTVDIHTH
ncbi:unnamed protein product [Trichobilharzia regenti]|nr:unnamed protein product [Trichobilharzia regenti]